MLKIKFIKIYETYVKVERIVENTNIVCNPAFIVYFVIDLIVYFEFTVSGINPIKLIKSLQCQVKMDVYI